MFTPKRSGYSTPYEALFDPRGVVKAPSAKQPHASAVGGSPLEVSADS